MLDSPEDFRSLLAHQMQRTIDDIDSAKQRKQTVAMIADNAREQLQALADISPERMMRACTKGCALCCSVPVDCSIPEAISIAKVVEQKSAVEQAAIHTKLAANTQTIRGLSIERHQKSIIPCALLADDNTCSIYSSRPLGCLGFTSTSLAICEEAYDNPEDQSIMMPQDLPLKLARSAVGMGMALAVKSKGLCTEAFELHSIVLLALENPKLGNQWLGGQKKFSAIRRGDSTSLRT